MLAAMLTNKQVRDKIDKLRGEKIAPDFRKAALDIADSLERLLDSASKGGTARAKKLSKKRRSEIASNAARIRWATPKTKKKERK